MWLAVVVAGELVLPGALREISLHTRHRNPCMYARSVGQ